MLAPQSPIISPGLCNRLPALRPTAHPRRRRTSGRHFAFARFPARASRFVALARRRLLWLAPSHLHPRNKPSHSRTQRWTDGAFKLLLNSWRLTSVSSSESPLCRSNGESLTATQDVENSGRLTNRDPPRWQGRGGCQPSTCTHGRQQQFPGRRREFLDRNFTLTTAHEGLDADGENSELTCKFSYSAGRHGDLSVSYVTVEQVRKCSRTIERNSAHIKVLKTARPVC